LSNISFASASDIKSPTKTGKTRRKPGKTATNNLEAANLNLVIDVPSGGTPSTLTGTSGTLEGTGAVSITDRFELLQKLECNSVAKWATKVKKGESICTILFRAAIRHPPRKRNVY